MKTIRKPALSCLLGLLSLGATAQDFSASMQRCRALAGAAERLACYDAIPLAEAARSAQAAPATATAAAPAAKAAPAPAQSAQSSFGLPAAATRPAEPEFVESQILGTFEGWEGRSIIKLANGQVWQVDDGSNGSYYLQSPKVKVRKGMLGAFFLDIEGAKKSPRVRRLQ